MGKMREFFKYKNVEIPPFFAVGLLLVFGTIFVEVVSLGYVFIEGILTNTLYQIHQNVVRGYILIGCLLVATGLFLINISKGGN